MHPSSLNRRRLVTGAALLAGAALLGACNDAGPGGGERDAREQGLRIVPLFGPERVDVSADIDWFGTRLGPVTGEQFLPDGRLFSVGFDDILDRIDETGLYQAASGEIGVQLRFANGPAFHYGRHDLPEPVDGFQRLEIPLGGIGRIDLRADGLADDDLVRFDISGATGSYGQTTGWRNVRGFLYLEPGSYRLALGREGQAEPVRLSVDVVEGQTAPAFFNVGG